MIFPRTFQTSRHPKPPNTINKHNIILFLLVGQGGGGGEQNVDGIPIRPKGAETYWDKFASGFCDILENLCFSKPQFSWESMSCFLFRQNAPKLFGLICYLDLGAWGVAGKRNIEFCLLPWRCHC